MKEREFFSILEIAAKQTESTQCALACCQQSIRSHRDPGEKGWIWSQDWQREGAEPALTERLHWARHFTHHDVLEGAPNSLVRS